MKKLFAEELISLTPDHLICRRGMNPTTKCVVGLMLSIVLTGSAFGLTMLLLGDWDEVMPAILAGAFNGACPLGVVFIVMNRGRTLWWSTAICYGVMALVTIGATFAMAYLVSIIEIAVNSWVGFGIGVVAMLIWAPREIVYRYAQCPGCKYNLALLSKSDVCPECGRDNRDLVEAFNGVNLRTKSSSSEADGEGHPALHARSVVREE